MLRTLDRYVIREVIPPFLLSLLVFTFILEVPPVMDQLETLVSKGVSWQTAGHIILLLIPQGLGLTIPMALLTGLLIGLGRLSSDRETVALLACGVSPYRLLRPVLVMATIAAAATLYVMVEAIPDANQRFREITFDLVSKRVENDIRPRVFFEDFPGWVLYARDQAPGGGWKDVMVADTHNPEGTSLYMAASGRLVLDRASRGVYLILVNGTRYSTTPAGEADIFRFPADQIMTLDADTVFGRMELPRGVSEKTIPQLRETIAQKRANHISPHPEIMGIQVKFSIPAACFVFALIGLALGVSVARDSKLAGFVLGIVVIFAYYVVMFLAESFAKGLYATPGPDDRFLFAYAARWIPNVALGAFGIAAVVWRARFAERRFPLAIPIGIPRLPGGWRRTDSRVPPAAGASTTPTVAGPRGVVVVLRIPRLRLPGPGLLDRYVSRLYGRTVALAFLALMGLFYIATFIDKSDKLFKGTASTGTVMQLLAYQTPQFVYYVIPIAALLSVLVTFGVLSRTSELTVMKACGVSLYRIALPVVALSLLWSAALFGLEQEILARANRRAGALDAAIRGLPPKTLNPLSRHWVIGRDGSIYHYGYFDPGQRVLTGLTIYRPAPDAWRLAGRTYASTAQYPGRLGGRERLAAGPRLAVADLAAVPARAAPDRAARVLRDRADRRRYDDGRPAPPVRRRAVRQRVRRRGAVGRTAAQAGVPARHLRDDAAGRALRRHHGPARHALRHWARGNPRPLVLVPDERLHCHRQGRTAVARPRRLDAQHHRGRGGRLYAADRQNIARRSALGLVASGSAGSFHRPRARRSGLGVRRSGL